MKSHDFTFFTDDANALESEDEKDYINNMLDNMAGTKNAQSLAAKGASGMLHYLSCVWTGD